MGIKQAFFLTIWTEEEIEGILERFPKLGERVRDYVVLASFNGQIVVHIIIQDMLKDTRLLQRIEYLGRDYREIAQKAKACDVTCQQVIGQIVFTNWMIDNPDPEGLERINYKGSLKEWIVAGKPKRLSGWQKAHDWLGNGLEALGDDEIE